MNKTETETKYLSFHEIVKEYGVELRPRDDKKARILNITFIGRWRKMFKSEPEVRIWGHLKQPMYVYPESSWDMVKTLLQEHGYLA